MYREAPQHVAATERDDGTEKFPRSVFKVTSVGLDKVQLWMSQSQSLRKAFDIGNRTAGIFVDNLDNVQLCPITRDKWQSWTLGKLLLRQDASSTYSAQSLTYY